MTQAQLDKETAPQEPSSSTDVVSWQLAPQVARIAHALGLVLGAVGLIIAVSLPFAPVWNDQTTVHWPADGAQVESTTAYLLPYRPASLQVTVPCSVIRAGLAAGERVTILTTIPAVSDREGLLVAAQRGSLQVVLGDRQVPLPPLPESCDLAIRADAEHATVTLGDRPPIELPGVPAPEIFVFATDLPPEQAAGMSASARAFAWFDTTATELKSVLLTISLVLIGCCLALLLAARPPTRLTRPRLRPTLLATDLVVGAVLVGWAVIGPLTEDDGFAIMIARDGDELGNYYRWFNASEAPFPLIHQLVQLVSEYSLQPVALRMPSVLAGLLTWLIVSRGIVQPLCRPGRRLPVHLLTALFFLTCWLPYAMGLRPEAFVALGSVATFAALLKATRDGTQAPLAWLGLAALAAGLTVASTPSGVLVLVTVALFGPRMFRLIVTSDDRPRWLTIAARVATLACVGSIAMVAMFADATWNDVIQATAIHNELGPSYAWYQEIVRYEELLSTDGLGAAGKRLAVFGAVAAMLMVGAAIFRRTHRLVRIPDAGLLLGALAGGIVTLWLTPTKWSHHFGALAGLGAAILAVSVVLLVRIGQLPGPRRTARLVGPAALLLVALVAALSFVGPNEWPVYSDFGMPWSDSPVRPGGLPLDNPLLWFAVGAAVAGVWAARMLLAGSAPDEDAPRSLGWTLMPAATLVVAAATSVAVLLGSFLAAPAAMDGSYSLAASNWDRLTNGANCSLEDHVQALPLADAATLQPSPDPGNVAQLDGFVPGGGLPGPPPPQEPQNAPLGPAVSATPFLWGSFEGGVRNTGTMTTEWFTLTELSADQVLSVWLAGRPEQGNSLTLEFGRAEAGQVADLGRHELRDPPATDLPYDDPRHGRPPDWRDFRPWRTLHVDAAEVPADADRVRLVGSDATTDEQGWFAVTAPVVREVVPLHQLLTEGGPTYVDRMVAFVVPCRADFPSVGPGVSEAPGTVLAPPAGEASSTFDPELGGVYAGMLSTSIRLEIPSRLAGAPEYTWGHVYSVVYAFDRDTYDVEQHRVRIGGTGGDGAYPFEEEDE